VSTRARVRTRWNDNESYVGWIIGASIPSPSLLKRSELQYLLEDGREEVRRGLLGGATGADGERAYRVFYTKDDVQWQFVDSEVRDGTTQLLRRDEEATAAARRDAKPPIGRRIEVEFRGSKHVKAGFYPGVVEDVCAEERPPGSGREAGETQVLHLIRYDSSTVHKPDVHWHALRGRGGGDVGWRKQQERLNISGVNMSRRTSAEAAENRSPGAAAGRRRGGGRGGGGGGGGEGEAREAEAAAAQRRADLHTQKQGAVKKLATALLARGEGAAEEEPRVKREEGAEPATPVVAAATAVAAEAAERAAAARAAEAAAAAVAGTAEAAVQSRRAALLGLLRSLQGRPCSEGAILGGLGVAVNQLRLNHADSGVQTAAKKIVREWRAALKGPASQAAASAATAAASATPFDGGSLGRGEGV